MALSKRGALAIEGATSEEVSCCAVYIKDAKTEEKVVTETISPGIAKSNNGEKHE